MSETRQNNYRQILENPFGGGVLRSRAKLIPSFGILLSLRKTPIKAMTGGLFRENSKVKFAPASVKQGCSVSVKREERIRSFATGFTGKKCCRPLRKILGSRKSACAGCFHRFHQLSLLCGRPEFHHQLMGGCDQESV